MSVFRGNPQDMDLDPEQRLYFIETSISNGWTDLSTIKQEFMESFSNPNFNWLNLAKKIDLFVDSSLYTEDEIKNYIKECLLEYLFPERKLSTSELDELAVDAKKILLEIEKNNQWIDYKDLYDHLVLDSKYSKLECYNLRRIDWKKIGVERRWSLRKYFDIGKFRLVKR